jgi:phosphoglycolate phosphatase
VEMKFKAVIFDLDGTLLDTLPDIYKSVNTALGFMGYPLVDYSVVLGGINRGARHLIKSVLPQGVRCDEEAVDNTLQAYAKVYAEHYNDSTKPYTGICDVLCRLKDHGFRLAVISNKPHLFVCELIKSHFGSIFDVVIGQGEFPAKPDPKAPMAAAERMGVLPQDTFLVGDSDVDMATAAAAGMVSVGVSWGYRSEGELISAGADHIARSTEELYSIITGAF